MGDLSAEPSMEEILSSIKRIIAEEGEAPSRPRRASRAAPVTAQSDEVLELSDPIPAVSAPAPLDSVRRERPVAQAEPEPAPERLAPVAASPDYPTDPIASPRTVGASRDALQSLSRMMVKPDAGSDGTLEGLVREMLRPMLRDWLDQNLPQIVETAVTREVARIAREGA